VPHDRRCLIVGACVTGAIEPLGPEDLAQAWELSRLAFGGDPAAPPPTTPGPGLRFGVRDHRGRLVAQTRLRDDEQWWGGRRVPMGGIASVAVHPDARGGGLATRLIEHLLGVMAERGQVLSVLFPTVVPLYRRSGWEVVGSIDETRLPTRDLSPLEASSCTVRTATADEDGATVRALWDAQARGGSGGLTRTGPMFPDGPAEAFDADVVALAEDADGRARGYLSYDRGRGYRAGAGELHVWEMAADSPQAVRALLASLARWHPVAGTTLWRGPVDELTLLTAGPVPAPATRQPWMLRVVNPAAAVAARGYPPEVTARAAFRLVETDGSGRGWHLDVRGGRGELEPATGAVAELHVRGLALLYSGAATTAMLLRTGLLSEPLPALDPVFAGPLPVLLDDF